MVIMRIGIDIDDVITDTSKEVEKYILKYDKNSEFSNHLEEIMRGEMPTQNIKNFFAKNALEIVKKAKLKNNVKEVLQKLFDEGNEIFIITSRGEIKIKGSEETTLEYFKSNNIKYTKILFNVFDKAKSCKENNINLMIDDSIKHCSECEKENIKSILFTSIVNQSIETKLDRVENWLELENKINQYYKK